MSFLPGALVAVGVLCLVNLVLIVALARRVRHQNERLAAGVRLPEVASLVTEGTKVREFTAVTVSGEQRTMGGTPGARNLVGLFSPNCPPCREQRSAFIELARTMPGGPAQVLAVINGPEEAAAEFAVELDGVASVVIEPPSGPVASVFAVPTRPAFFLVDADGRIEASARKVRMLDAVPA